MFLEFTVFIGGLRFKLLEVTLFQYIEKSFFYYIILTYLPMLHDKDLYIPFDNYFKQLLLYIILAERLDVARRAKPEPELNIILHTYTFLKYKYIFIGLFIWIQAVLIDWTGSVSREFFHPVPPRLNVYIT